MKVKVSCEVEAFCTLVYYYTSSALIQRHGAILLVLQYCMIASRFGSSREKFQVIFYLDTMSVVR
jgi:hypothetical protein